MKQDDPSRTGTLETAWLFPEEATCLGCGCTCDDGLDRITRSDCSRSREWFVPHPGRGRPAATIAGEPVPLAEALDRAAATLAGARAPLLWGLTQLSVEAAAEAVRIADRIGGTVDTGAEFAPQAAFSRVGAVGATLGEVRDRADLVVLWRFDPADTHPRFLERFVDPPGRFVPGGRTGRSLLRVESTPGPTDDPTNQRCRPVGPEQAGLLLHILRGLVTGRTLDPSRVEQATGLPFDRIRGLADRLMGARYGAIIEGPSDTDADPVAAEAMHLLVRDLNGASGRRFVHVRLGGAGNGPGVESVLLWQTGAPGSIDFAAGYPRFLPGEATWAARRDAVDALLVLGTTDPPDRPSELATIRIGPGANRPDQPPALVAIDTGRTGIEFAGTVARTDGVMIPAAAVLDPGTWLDDRAVLRELANRLIG